MTIPNVSLGFSTVKLTGHQQSWDVWEMVLPGVRQRSSEEGIPVRCWCDCDIEVNPANGKFAQQIRECVPGETIWEMNSVYFSYNDEVAAFWNPPSLIR